MNELFGRVWATTIGPAGAKGRTWDKLRTAFRVEKTKGSTPNKLELTIYNLSADSRAYIAKRHVVLLEAGTKAPAACCLLAASRRWTTSARAWTG